MWVVLGEGGIGLKRREGRENGGGRRTTFVWVPFWGGVE